MICGAKWSENGRWTFGGSDRTPGLDVDVTLVVEEVVADEILTCVTEQLVRRVCERVGVRTRESLEPAELNSRSSVTSSSSVNVLGSSASLEVVVAGRAVADLDVPASPDGLFGVGFLWVCGELDFVTL